jgi:hypothetical protein
MYLGVVVGSKFDGYMVTASQDKPSLALFASNDEPTVANELDKELLDTELLYFRFITLCENRGYQYGVWVKPEVTDMSAILDLLSGYAKSRQKEWK